jgi:hypothetical protein
MIAFIRVMRTVFDVTAVRVILILLLGIPGLGFLVWTLLIEGTGFFSFFNTATAGERAALRLAAITYWILVIGWLGVFLRLLCSSSYLDMLPVLRFFVLLLLGVFTIAWIVLLLTSMSARALINFIPIVLTLLFFVGTLPLPRHASS